MVTPTTPPPTPTPESVAKLTVVATPYPQPDFRTRTALSLTLGPQAADGTQNATGALAVVTGEPLPDVVVELTMKALDGPGLSAEYTITGAVPARAIRSDVGFRVNTECGCQGTSEFVVYQVRYTEGDESASQVPNSDFDITFQDAEAEFARERIQLAPAIVRIGAATTDTQGRYTINLGSLPRGRLLLEANYAGSDQYWPAYASIVPSLFTHHVGLLREMALSENARQ